MTKRAKIAALAVLASVALLGGGYLIYRSLTAESEEGLRRQRERLTPTDGSAVHPSQRPKG